MKSSLSLFKWFAPFKCSMEMVACTCFLYPIKNLFARLYPIAILWFLSTIQLHAKSMYFLPGTMKVGVKLNLHEAGSIPEVKLQRWIQLIGRNEAERDPTLLGLVKDLKE